MNRTDITYNRLYEQIMYDISVHIKYAINEAYDNQLLEKYEIRDLLNSIQTNGSKASKILYVKLKKLLIYIIEKLQETNQYKKAEKIVSEYKKRLTKYIDDHKQLTPRRMLKIMVTVLTIYGGVSLVLDCKSLIKGINNDIDLSTIEYVDVPAILTIIAEIPNDVKDVENLLYNISSDETPKEYYESSNGKINFNTSKKAKEFIKSHENLLLYPYYATQAEEAKGMVTIGYGHVILPTDGNLYKQVEQLKKQGKIKRSYVRLNGKYVLNPNHCKEIISKLQAEELFNKDIKIAEERAIKSIKNSDANDNVKYYILYNQDMMDGFTSLCYNAGFLRSDKYRFIYKGLNNCRYDTENNCINQDDYALTCDYFTSLKQNNGRRVNEYKLFLKDANGTFKPKLS